MCASLLSSQPTNPTSLTHPPIQLPAQVFHGSAAFAQATERGAVQAGHLLLAARSGEEGYTTLRCLEAAAAELGGPCPPLLVYTWKEVEDIDDDEAHCEHVLCTLVVAAPPGGVPLLPLLRHVCSCADACGVVRLCGMHVDFGALASALPGSHQSELLRLDLAGCTVDLPTLPALLRRCPGLESVSFFHGCRIAPLPAPRRQLVVSMHRNFQLDMTGLDLGGVDLLVQTGDKPCVVLLPSHHISMGAGLEEADCYFVVNHQPCCSYHALPLQPDEWRQLRGGGDGGAGGSDLNAAGAAGTQRLQTAGGAGAAAANPAFMPASLELDEWENLGLRVDVGGRHRALDLYLSSVVEVDLDIIFVERGALFCVWRRFPHAVRVYVKVSCTATYLDCKDMHFLEGLHVSGDCDMLQLDVSCCAHLCQIDTDDLVGCCFVTADDCPKLQQ